MRRWHAPLLVQATCSAEPEAIARDDVPRLSHRRRAGSTTPAPAAGVGTRIKLWLKTLARPSKFLLDTAALAGVGVGPCVTWPETVTTSEGGCVPEAEPVRSVSSLEGA